MGCRHVDDAWGDFTSAFQRMQLVMFIRSLSSERGSKTELSSAIYKTFDHADFLVEQARIEQYSNLSSSQALSPV